jgi:hypothetical protein
VGVPGLGESVCFLNFSGCSRSCRDEPGPPNLSVLGFLRAILAVLLITLVVGVLVDVSLATLFALVAILRGRFVFFGNLRIGARPFWAALVGRYGWKFAHFNSPLGDSMTKSNARSGVLASRCDGSTRTRAVAQTAGTLPWLKALRPSRSAR